METESISFVDLEIGLVYLKADSYTNSTHPNAII